MKFEVRKGKTVYMQTTDESCIPDKETRADMRRAGYTLYKDGKVFKETKSGK